MLGIAASVYFVANTGSIATVISLREEKSLKKIMVECYFWSFPYYLVGAGIAGAIGWFNRTFNWETSLLLLPVIYLIYRSYRLYLGKLEDEKRHVEEMASLHLRTIEALALAIEAKDHTTHEHLQRVRVYAIEIAKELSVSPRNWKRCTPPPCCTISANSPCPNTSFPSPGADSGRIREDEDPSGGGRGDSGTRAVPLSGGADRPRAPRKVGRHRISLRASRVRRFPSARAFFRRSIAWTRWLPTASTAARCRWKK